MDKKEFIKPRYDPNHMCRRDKDLHTVADDINGLMIFHKSCYNDKTNRVMIWIDGNPYTSVKRIILEFKEIKK